MSNISDIAKYMIEKPSSIREIMNLMAEFKKNPEKFPRPLIYLAGGWPQDKPPEVLRRSLLNVLNDTKKWIKSAQYSPTIGYPEIREAIVEYEKEIFGRKIDSNQVIFGLGSTDQIGAVINAVVDLNEEIIMTAPGYLNYYRQAQFELKNKVKIKYWRIIDEEGSFSPNIDNLRNLISDKTKLIIITTPGNPEGIVWDDETINKIRDLAEEKGIYILLDLAYRAFIYGKKPQYLSEPLKENEIISCTLSKELRIPGWRASYLLVPADLVRAIETIEQARILAPVSLIQVVLTEIFRDKEKLTEIKKFYKDGARLYATTAKKTAELLSEIPNLKILEPQSGFYVFFDISQYEKNSKKAWQELIYKYQVALAPGIDFNNFEGWLRLSFAPVIEDQDKLWEGIRRIKEYFQRKKIK